mgnify:CR=1 FL=1
MKKQNAQHFGAYQHNGGRIGVISVIEGGDEALAKQISMHIAAMKPTVLSYKELDEQFVKDELAQLNHVIDQDNESRAMVGKPALPHLKYGSKAQLTDEVIAQAEADIKAELAAEGKPEKSGIRSSQVRWIASCLTTLKLTKHTHFLHKSTSWTTARQWEAYLESVMLQLLIRSL